MSVITFEELDRTVRRVRSLSGCFRLARSIEQRDMDVEKSRDKIPLLSQLLTKMKELSDLDPETIVSHIDPDTRTLIRSYAVVLSARAGQRNLGGEDLAEGEADARKALKMARTIRDEAVESLALNHLGNHLMLAQCAPEAHACFRASADLDRRNKSDAALARSLYNLARAELALGNFQSALESVTEGLSLYERDSSLPSHAHAFFLSVRQDIYESQDEPGLALADGLRSLKLFEQTGMTDRLATAHFHLVRRYITLDQPSDAMHHALQASSAATQSENPVDRILSLTALASVYIRLDDLESAEQFSREGLELAQAIQLRPMEVLCLERLARIARRRGESDEARRLLYEALEKEDRRRNRAELHRIIASFLLDQGELETAQEEIQTGLDLFYSLQDMKADAEYLLVSAAIAYKAGRFDTALETLLSVIDRENLRLAFRKEAHRILSELYATMNNAEKALHHHQHYHAVSIQMEGKLAEHRLIAFRAQHEVESHRREAQEARAQQQRTSQEKEILALDVSERERVMEQIRQNIGHAVRSLTQNKIKEGESRLQEVLRLLHTIPASNNQLLHHLPNLDKEFFQRLQQRYPDLTKGQLRLCGLLRSGLSSSEIAQHLHLSIETVTTQRKRLRKKMNLQAGENLEKVLTEI